MLSLITFIAFYYFLFKSGNSQLSEDKVSNYAKKIIKISSNNNILTLSFANSMSFDQVFNFSYHFILFTKAFDLPLILNHESILKISKETENVYNIYYDFPFVMKYLCFLKIFSEVPIFRQRSLFQRYDAKLNSKKAIKTYEISFTLTSFEDMHFINNKTSHLQCFGNSSLTRWCDMRNIGYIQTRLLFYTYSYYKFPSPFMSIGCRAPPFDIIEDRLYDEPLITSPQPSISYSFNYTDITYIVGRFHNSMMMWHVLFDFMIPLYWTINKIEGSFGFNTNRTILLRDSQYQILCEFIQTFSKNPIKNIKNDVKSYFFKRAIVGLPKFEKDPNKYRRISNMATFTYNFDENISIGLREVVMNGFKIDSEEINHENPTVIYVSRANSHRDLTNSDEVIKLMKSVCDFCDIKSVTFHQLSPRKQIEVASKASALVGLHGSGLTHVLWLPRSKVNFTSVLLEILPYKYWCRNWYKTAANVAGVNYFSTMNTGRILPDVEASSMLKYKFCCLTKSKCESIECNDVLKDQRFQMELDTFNSTWINVVDILKKNRENARKKQNH